MQTKSPTFSHLDISDFLNIQNNHFFNYHKEFFLRTDQLQSLLHNLNHFCYLISEKNQSIFETQLDFYDTDQLEYSKKEIQQRPNRIQVFKQNIHTTSNILSSLNIENIKFSKTKTLNLPCKTSLNELQINQFIQTHQIITPYLYYSHSISFDQIILFQPHSNTQISLQINTYKSTNLNELPIHPNLIRIKTISPKRNNQILNLIKSQTKKSSTSPILQIKV